MARPWAAARSVTLILSRSKFPQGTARNLTLAWWGEGGAAGPTQGRAERETGHLSSATVIWADTLMFPVNPAPERTYTMAMRSLTPGLNQTPSPQYTRGLSAAPLYEPSCVSLHTSRPSVPSILLLSHPLDCFLCRCWLSFWF